VLSGVAGGPALAADCGNGFAVVGADCLVRFGAPFELPPNRGAVLLGFGGETTTGSS